MGAVLQRLRQFSFLSALLRLLLAMLSGGVVGFGRKRPGPQAFAPICSSASARRWPFC